MVDPNPLVSGRGIRRLVRAGIQVDVGVLEEECRKLNEAFVKHATRRIPFVTLKLAASLDGKIATSVGDSRWITEPSSRAFVHRMRDRVDAVLVGVGTVVRDDPRLTCRVRGGRDPWRVVLDPRLRIPLASRLLRGRGAEKTIVATGPRPPKEKVKTIESYGAKVWRFSETAGGIPFGPLLKKLGDMGMLSVMIEGGADTAGRALKAGVVDKLLLFYAPKIIGGGGIEMIGELGIKNISGCKRIRDMEVKRFRKDFLVTGYL